MILKIINSVLILSAVFTGLKHGWNMFTAKPDILDRKPIPDNTFDESD